MKRVLSTGMSGTGKSTVIAEFAARLKAVDSVLETPRGGRADAGPAADHRAAVAQVLRLVGDSA